MNYSFWADEAYISGIALQLIQGNLSIANAFSQLHYQKLYILIISIFFKLFGESELTARLPSIIAYLFGIIVIFLIAKRLSNLYGGVLSSFIFGFSHLNISYATQTKPYIFLEMILLSIILFIIDINKKRILHHILIIALLTVASLLHTIGIFIWIIYIYYLTASCYQFYFSNKKNAALFLFLLGGISLTIFLVIFSIFSIRLFPYNNLYQVLKLFLYKYPLLLMFAALGYVWNYMNTKIISIGVLLYVIVILVLSAFQQYIFNIRYVLTIFGIIFLYFGVFWAKVGEKFDNKIKIQIPNSKFRITGKAIVPLAVLILFYATGYKIVKGPQAYYNPNIDKYGDVQIANYKDFYSELKSRFPQYKKLYVINDTFDVEYWYFGRYANAYFSKSVHKPTKHHVVDAMVYSSLSDFKKVITQHPQGLLIIEDWQSFLPDDVKEYAKKNLKLEFRVESLKEAPDDPWPLALYSWGF